MMSALTEIERKNMYNRRLFLTSDGLSDNMKIKFFNIIKKKPEETKILYIPTAGIATDSAREGLQENIFFTY